MYCVFLSHSLLSPPALFRSDSELVAILSSLSTEDIVVDRKLGLHGALLHYKVGISWCWWSPSVILRLEGRNIWPAAEGVLWLHRRTPLVTQFEAGQGTVQHSEASI